MIGSAEHFNLTAVQKLTTVISQGARPVPQPIPMHRTEPTRPPAVRRILRPILVVLLTYAALELAAYLAFESVTGTAFASTTAEEVRAPSAPDLRAGREQAGLGMRDAAMSLHPYFGYVFTPRGPDAPPNPLAISPEGFLDDEIPVRRRDDSRLLVGIVGGSVAGQLGTWHSEHLRRAIAAQVLGEGQEVEFVKLGMPGYHQPQQLQQLTYVLAQGGELDVLLNIDGFNEVAVPAALNAPRGTHPLFPMNWSMVALDVPDLGVRRDIGAIEFLTVERRERAAAFRDSWRSWTVWGRLLWRLEDQRLADRAAEHAWSLQQFEVDEVPFFVRGPQRHHEPPEGLVPFCVDVWKRSSLQMRALCEANGIRYLHFLQPNQYLPGSKPLTSEERATAYEAEGPYRPVIEEGYPLMQAAGRELAASGVEFHDLSGLFQDVEETLYVDNCCHFNGFGNELMSAAIADAMAF